MNGGRSSAQSTRSRLEYDPEDFVEEEEEIASDEEAPLDTAHLSVPSPSSNFDRGQHARHSSRRRRWLRGAGPISLSIDLPTPEERPDELEMYEEGDEEMLEREVKATDERQQMEGRDADRDSDSQLLSSGDHSQRARDRGPKMEAEEDVHLLEAQGTEARCRDTEERGFREVFISLNGPGVGISSTAPKSQNNLQRAVQPNAAATGREVFISTDSREVPRARHQERYDQLLAHFTRNGGTEDYFAEDVPIQQLRATSNGNGVAVGNGSSSPQTPLQQSDSVSPSPASARYSSQSNGQQHTLLPKQQQPTASPEVIRNRFHQTAQSPTPPEPSKKRHSTQSPRSRRMIECVLTQNDEDSVEVPVASPQSGRNYRHLEAALSHITKPLLATHKEVSLS